FQGIVQDIPKEMHEGRWLGRDNILARIIQTEVNMITAYVRSQDLERLEEVAPARERSMTAEDKERFRRDRERLQERLAQLETGESGLDVAVSELRRLQDSYTDEDRTATVRGLTAWIQSYLQLVERLSLVPAQARLEVISVEEVELQPERAFQIALSNRLDFMNGRAALVDRWRTIQVAADALQSDLTITGSGDVRTATNNPVDFRAATSRLRLGIEFDAPLARLLERNGYRETLIEYQRDRRNLIQSRDSLQRGLRALLRTLKQRKLQLEIQRRAVTIALRRVDQTQLSLLSPPPQGQPGVRPQINPTTAINLLGAQSSLQNSQNSFLAAWLNYYAARLRLFRELGVMQLDPTGRWIENAIDLQQDFQTDPLQELPPEVPTESLQANPIDDRFRMNPEPQVSLGDTLGPSAVIIRPLMPVPWNGEGAEPKIRIAEQAPHAEESQ
ncbi:MAG: TolC family protein, partial [Planctomycetota bacterium]